MKEGWVLGTYFVLDSLERDPRRGRAPIPCGGRVLKRFPDSPDDVVIITALRTAISKSRRDGFKSYSGESVGPQEGRALI